MVIYQRNSAPHSAQRHMPQLSSYDLLYPIRGMQPQFNSRFKLYRLNLIQVSHQSERNITSLCDFCKQWFKSNFLPTTGFKFRRDMSHKQIYYSDKYNDEHYEYRHVVLPRELAKQVPKSHLMSEEEWRRIGVQQSLGWVHYMIHEPEPHILLFRRPLPKH